MSDLDTSVNTFAIPYSALVIKQGISPFLTYGSLHGIRCTIYNHTVQGSQRKVALLHYSAVVDSVFSRDLILEGKKWRNHLFWGESNGLT